MTDDNRSRLILSRKIGQTVNIGEGDSVVDVIIKDVKFEGPDATPIVDLVFEAPKYISVDRKEIRQQRADKMDRLFNGQDQ
jgi:sRNA-binding carbon storage regulator CsrA